VTSNRFLRPGEPGVDGPTRTGYLGWPADPEIRVRDPLPGHLSDVGAVEAIYPPPKGWLAVRARWQEFLELASPHADALADEIATGLVSDLAALRACALAELAATREADAELRQLVGAKVHGELTRLWQPHAKKAFTAAGAVFDNGGDDAALDQAALILAAAARLCGADPNVAGWAVDRLQLALCVDVTNTHPRRVAVAFTGPDHWNAVRELGARLRAASDPLAEYPALPALAAFIDANHVVRKHDPLDGPPPHGWRPIVDGWEDENPVWSVS
jgi:hypothetical protein